MVLTALSVADAPFLKTGQTLSYDVDGNVVTDGSVKDDGYYQRGVIRSYGRSGDIVIDNATGLEWEDNETVLEKWEDGSSYPAAEYCDSFDLGGYDDWRLPSMQELLTIVDVSQYNPSLTEGIFSYISLNNHYWSSTAFSKTGYSNYVWFLHFGTGSTSVKHKSDDAYVRCVRGRPLEPSSFSRNDATEIVTDTATGLQWQDNEIVNTTARTWIDAIDYCENTLALGNYSDWRSPNINELLSIVEYSQYDQAIYSVFVNKLSFRYWSSTTLADDTRLAWIVQFTDGSSAGNYSKSSDSYVRCVRDGQVDTSTFDPSIIMYLLN